MKKREVHKQGFVPTRIIVLLENILRCDENFLYSINLLVGNYGTIVMHEIYGSRRKTESIVERVIRPKWWPGNTFLSIDFSEKYGTYGKSVSLYFPQIPQISNVILELNLLSHLPFFEPCNIIPVAARSEWFYSLVREMYKRANIIPQYL